MSCSAAEIAEKKRIALEKLKSKKSQLNTANKTTNNQNVSVTKNINNNNNVVASKPLSAFPASSAKSTPSEKAPGKPSMTHSSSANNIDKYFQHYHQIQQKQLNLLQPKFLKQKHNSQL